MMKYLFISLLVFLIAGCDSKNMDAKALADRQKLGALLNMTVDEQGYFELDYEHLIPKNYVEVDYEEMQYTGEFFSQIEAPVVDELDNQKVSLPGFVVPIKHDGDLLYEFLLVPYLGACIHSPPPPTNQMFYVVSEEPVTYEDIWTPVLVKGTLNTLMQSSELGNSGYRLTLESIEEFL